MDYHDNMCMNTWPKTWKNVVQLVWLGYPNSGDNKGIIMILNLANVKECQKLEGILRSSSNDVDATHIGITDLPDSCLSKRIIWKQNSLKNDFGLATWQFDNSTNASLDKIPRFIKN